MLRYDRSVILYFLFCIFIFSWKSSTSRVKVFTVQNFWIEFAKKGYVSLLVVQIYCSWHIYVDISPLNLTTIRMIETSSGEQVDFSSFAQRFDAGRPINPDLIYQGRERMVLILQTLSNLFCSMKIIVFWFKFQLNVPIDNNPGLIQIMAPHQKKATSH